MSNTIVENKLETCLNACNPENAIECTSLCENKRDEAIKLLKQVTIFYYNYYNSKNIIFLRKNDLRYEKKNMTELLFKNLNNIISEQTKKARENAELFLRNVIHNDKIKSDPIKYTIGDVQEIFYYLNGKDITKLEEKINYIKYYEHYLRIKYLKYKNKYLHLKGLI